MSKFEKYLSESKISTSLQKRIDKFEDEYHDGDIPSDDLIQDAYKIISQLIDIIGR